MEKAAPQDQLFSDLWKSFLGMYQIFTGEDWTKFLYTMTQNDSGQKLGWIGAIFIVLWFAVSSIIILNMFLSRIDDSLNLPDDTKRLFQISKFIRKQVGRSPDTTITGYTVVSAAAAPIQLYRELSAEQSITITIDTFLRNAEIWKKHVHSLAQLPGHEDTHATGAWIRLGLARASGVWNSMTPKRQGQSYPVLLNQAAKIYGKLQRGCQALLNQGRYSPRRRHFTLKDSFTIFINMSIIAQILITCVTTPLYQRSYFLLHEFSIKNWFFFVDFGFALLWSVEGAIKIIAGGLIIGPHAYLRGWNLIDAIVLASYWIGLALTWYNVGRSAAALVASFKAFRVLRLLTLNKKIMREITLVFSSGGYRLFASILVSLSLLIPFAVLGVNLFVGQANFCNDPSILHHSDCVGEFFTSDEIGILTPRVVSRPYYSFDNFGQSFYTLFLIVSQEGWTDVMNWARGISYDASQSGASDPISGLNSNMNALFFVVFNFCGTIFVTALFASVMIHNYTEATGVAYLTYPQKGWIEQKRLLLRVRPSRRPTYPEKMARWRKWCYNLATQREGIWPKIMIATLVVYMVVLCADLYPVRPGWPFYRGNPRKVSL
jgi:hypothetical protein